MVISRKWRAFVNVARRCGIIQGVLAGLARPFPWLWRWLGPLSSGVRLRAAKKILPKRLHLGCGNILLTGWINADLAPQADYYIDARYRLPFEDRWLTAVYLEEVIEHLSLSDGLRLLKECFRCLAKKGRIRITTPDLDFIIGLRRGGPDVEEALQLHAATFDRKNRPFHGLLLGDYVNDAFFLHGHLYLYDFETLSRSLAAAGFRNIIRSSYKKSCWPEFLGIDSHIQRYPAPKASTLYVEAEKL